MLVHRRVTPSIKLSGTHLYTCVERGTVRVECLVQEHNTMFLTRTRTRTARSGDEFTNHEDTAPLHLKPWCNYNIFLTLGKTHHSVIGCVTGFHVHSHGDERSFVSHLVTTR